MSSLIKNLILPIILGLFVFLVSSLIRTNVVNTVAAIVTSAALCVVLLRIADSKEKPQHTSNSDDTHPETNENISVGPAHADRVPPKITPHYLVDLYRDYSRDDANKVIRPYLDKQMRFRGKVFSIDGDRCVFLTSEGIKGNDRVLAYFDDDEFKDVTILLKNKTIAVQGELVGADTFFVTLRHCRIQKGGNAAYPTPHETKGGSLLDRRTA